MRKARPLALLALGALLLFALTRALALLDLVPKYLNDGYAGQGASLLYGIPDTWISYSMPVAPLLITLLSKLDDAALRAWLLMFELLVPVCAFLLGFALEGAACGWAALLIAIFLTPTAPVASENSLEALLVTSLFLLTALALVWRARERSQAATFGLAAVLLAGLFVRSPLAFLPLAVLAADLWRERSWKVARAAAPLFWLPVLGLFPWAFMNWRIFGSFTFLENGRSVTNIVTGALGMVHTYPAGYVQGLWLAHLKPGDNVSWWAVRQVLNHPFQYLQALPFRFALFVSWHPLLLSASVLCFWLRRNRPEYRALALLVAYYVGLHCLLAIEPRYFLPLWPLCGVLAAALVFKADVTAKRVPRTALKAAALLTAPFLAFGAYALALGSTYLGRSGEAVQGYGPLLRDHPDAALLWRLAGRKALQTGDACAAAEAHARAVRLSPTPENRAAYSKALAARVSARQFLGWPEPRRKNQFLVDSDLMQALSFQSMGVEARARSHFAAFKNSWFEDPCKVRKMRAMEALPFATFQSMCREGREELMSRVSDWPAEERRRFARRLEFFGCRR